MVLGNASTKCREDRSWYRVISARGAGRTGHGMGVMPVRGQVMTWGNASKGTGHTWNQLMVQPEISPGNLRARDLEQNLLTRM